MVKPFGLNTPKLETDRQDIQRSDSIGRTVLQTVAQKQLKYHKENEDGLILGQAGPPSLTAAYTCSLHKLLLHQVSHLVSQLFLNFLKCSVLTSAQEQLKWATVPEQSGPKNGGLLRAPFRGWAAGSQSKTMSPGPRPSLSPYQVAS